MHYKKKERSRISWLRTLLALVAAAVFLYSSWQLYRYWDENRASGLVTEELIGQAVSVVSRPTVSAPPVSSVSSFGEEPLPPVSYEIPLQVDFAALQAENPDIVGWLYCEGTPIHYPVVQGEDNEYYLHRLPDGSTNANGSLFMDYRSDQNLGSLHTVIYGHNMISDAMFGSLEEYKKQAYYDVHPQLWLLTPQCAYRVDLFAGLVVSYDSEFYRALTDETELTDFVRSAMTQSTFDAELDPGGVTQVVTLSTCSYEYDSARYVVMGSLVPAEYPD